ncbi:MAG TPA: hypothetical protein VD816_18645, partial [Ohtaekwangia sp.]|nr:hypothetical protein [Ohtaekwangia sp.]
MMKTLKITAFLIFIAGFAGFNLTFFLATYKLTDGAVAHAVPDANRKKLFMAEAAPFFDQTFHSSFAFVSMLDKVFDAVNEKQRDRYGLTAEELDELSGYYSTPFSTALIDSVFRTSNETAAFKNKALKDYGGHLAGRRFSSKEELLSELQSVRKNIGQYGTINQVGFDRYAVKE